MVSVFVRVCSFSNATVTVWEQHLRPHHNWQGCGRARKAGFALRLATDAGGNRDQLEFLLGVFTNYLHCPFNG